MKSPGDMSAFTILIVDDEDTIRAIVGQLLKLDGFTTTLEAGSGEEALPLAEDYPGPIHLLLTDVRMAPRMNGRELAQAMRKIRPEIKVLYMSAYSDDESVQEDVKDAKAEFISKPFNKKTLVGKIREMLGVESGSSL